MWKPTVSDGLGHMFLFDNIQSLSESMWCMVKVTLHLFVVDTKVKLIKTNYLVRKSFI